MCTLCLKRILNKMKILKKMCWPLVTINVLLYPSALSFSVNHLLVLTSHQTPGTFPGVKNLTSSLSGSWWSNLSLSAPCFLFRRFQLPSLVFSELVVVRTYCLTDHQFPISPLSSPGEVSKSPLCLARIMKLAREKKIMCVCIYIFSMCDKYYLEN